MLVQMSMLSANAQQGHLRTELMSSKHVHDKRETTEGKLDSLAKLASSDTHQMMGISGKQPGVIWRLKVWTMVAYRPCCKSLLVEVDSIMKDSLPRHVMLDQMTSKHSQADAHAK